MEISEQQKIITAAGFQAQTAYCFRIASVFYFCVMLSFLVQMSRPGTASRPSWSLCSVWQIRTTWTVSLFIFSLTFVLQLPWKVKPETTFTNWKFVWLEAWNPSIIWSPARPQHEYSMKTCFYDCPMKRRNKKLWKAKNITPIFMFFHIMYHIKDQIHLFYSFSIFLYFFLTFLH